MPAGDAAKTRAAQQAERERRAEWLEMAQVRSGQLKSIVDSLYTELDKLAKKWPSMPVSDLMLQRINKAIRECRTLMDPDGDDFLQEINEFVPAGDNPESRDALLVLSELQAANSRFRSAHYHDWL